MPTHDEDAEAAFILDNIEASDAPLARPPAPTGGGSSPTKVLKGREERRRVETLLGQLELAKAKARAQRADYAKYLTWKVNMQRSERKKHEEEEEKLRARVEEKLLRVLADHRAQRRAELTAYRGFVNKTAASVVGKTLHDVPASRGNKSDSGYEPPIPKNYSYARYNRRIIVPDSYAAEDAHYAAYQLEQQRKREEWAATKATLRDNYERAYGFRNARGGKKQRRGSGGRGYIQDDSRHRQAQSAAVLSSNMDRLLSVNIEPERHAVRHMHQRPSQANRDESDSSEPEGPTMQGYTALMTELIKNRKDLRRENSKKHKQPEGAQPPEGEQRSLTPTAPDEAALRREKLQKGLPRAFVLSTTRRAEQRKKNEEREMRRRRRAEEAGQDTTDSDEEEGEEADDDVQEDELTIVRPSMLSKADLRMMEETEKRRNISDERRTRVLDMAARARARKLYTSAKLAADPPADFLISNNILAYLPIQQQAVLRGDLNRERGIYEDDPADIDDGAVVDLLALEDESKQKSQLFITQQDEFDPDTKMSKVKYANPTPKRFGRDNGKHLKLMQSNDRAGSVPVPAQPPKDVSARLVQIREIPRTAKTSWYIPYNPYAWMDIPLPSQHRVAIESFNATCELEPDLEVEHAMAKCELKAKTTATGTGAAPRRLEPLPARSPEGTGKTADGIHVARLTPRKPAPATAPPGDVMYVVAPKRLNGANMQVVTTAAEYTAPIDSGGGAPMPRGEQMRVVAVKYPARNLNEERALLDWHYSTVAPSGYHLSSARGILSGEGNISVLSRTAPVNTSSEQNSHAKGAGQIQPPVPTGWQRNTRPFLPPLKSIFVDPDLKTTEKFLKKERDRR